MNTNTLNIPSYETDVVIIGAGPVGLFAVFEAGLQHGTQPRLEVQCSHGW